MNRLVMLVCFVVWTGGCVAAGTEGESLGVETASLVVAGCPRGQARVGAVCRGDEWVTDTFGDEVEGALVGWSTCAEHDRTDCALLLFTAGGTAETSSSWSSHGTTYALTQDRCMRDCLGGWDIVERVEHSLSVSESNVATFELTLYSESTRAVGDAPLGTTGTLEWSIDASSYSVTVRDPDGTTLASEAATASSSTYVSTCTVVLAALESAAAVAVVGGGLFALALGTGGLGLFGASAALANAAALSSSGWAAAAISGVVLVGFRDLNADICEELVGADDGGGYGGPAPGLFPWDGPDGPGPGPGGGGFGGGGFGGGGGSDDCTDGAACAGGSTQYPCGDTCCIESCNGTTDGETCECVLDLNDCVIEETECVEEVLPV